MTQQIKLFAVKPDNLSLIPGIHSIKRELTAEAVPCPPLMCPGTRTPMITQANTYNQSVKYGGEGNTQHWPLTTISDCTHKHIQGKHMWTCTTHTHTQTHPKLGWCTKRPLHCKLDPQIQGRRRRKAEEHRKQTPGNLVESGQTLAYTTDWLWPHSTPADGWGDTDTWEKLRKWCEPHTQCVVCSFSSARSSHKEILADLTPQLSIFSKRSMDAQCIQSPTQLLIHSAFHCFCLHIMHLGIQLFIAPLR